MAYWRAKRGTASILRSLATCRSGFFPVVRSNRSGGFYCSEYWGRRCPQSFWDVAWYWKGGVIYYGGIVGSGCLFRYKRSCVRLPYHVAIHVLSPFDRRLVRCSAASWLFS